MSVTEVQVQLSTNEAIVLLFDTPEWKPTQKRPSFGLSPNRMCAGSSRSGFLRADHALYLVSLALVAAFLIAVIVIVRRYKR
jgi:hypothetical protein